MKYSHLLLKTHLHSSMHILKCKYTYIYYIYKTKFLLAFVSLWSECTNVCMQIYTIIPRYTLFVQKHRESRAHKSQIVECVRSMFRKNSRLTHLVINIHTDHNWKKECCLRTSRILYTILFMTTSNLWNCILF